MKRLFPILCALLCACTPESEPRERLQLNVRYNLDSWPDSLYIASLDSVLNAEPVKKDSDSNKTEISINTRNMPIISLPHSRETKAEGKSAVAKSDSRNTVRTESTPATPQSEAFANRFSAVLANWQSDPANPQFYQIVKANEGEDLFQVLTRTYGKEASRLPRFYTLSTLQSVNPGVSLEHLKKGDAIRIPRW
jgi:hypothetical protein